MSRITPATGEFAFIRHNTNPTAYTNLNELHLPLAPRINFGQAALIAQTEGIKVATVIVADDCALPEGKGITGGEYMSSRTETHRMIKTCLHAPPTHDPCPVTSQAAALPAPCSCTLCPGML